MKRLIGFMLSLSLLIGILTGCAETPADSGTSASPQGTVSDPADSSASTEGTWPRTIEDSLGNEVTLEKKPERVALLDFGFMETVFALNVSPIASILADRSLYGFGTLKPYSEDAQVEELGSLADVNLEKLLELEPDLIFMTAGGKLDMTTYEAASKIAPVIAFDISDWKEQLRAFAECLGEEETAETFIAEIETLIEESREKLATYSDKTVALMFETSNRGTFAVEGASDDSVWYNGESGLGLTPPNDPGMEGSVSLEGLATMDPDYIFVFGSIGTEENGYEQTYLSEETQSSSVWQSLTAVKNGNVYYLDAAVRAAGPLAIKQGVEDIVESMTEAS